MTPDKGESVKRTRSSFAVSTLAFLVCLGTIACSIQTRKTSEPIATGEETARAAGERTRKAQEADETGLIYATSESETDPTDQDADVEDVDAEPTEQDASASEPPKLRWTPDPETQDASESLDLESIRTVWTQARDESIGDLEIELPATFEPDATAQLAGLAYSLGFERIVIVREEVPADQIPVENEASESPEPDPAAP